MKNSFLLATLLTKNKMDQLFEFKEKIVIPEWERPSYLWISVKNISSQVK